MSLRDLNSWLGATRGLRTRNRILFSSIDSTNGFGKRIAADYQRSLDDLPTTLVLAMEQTAGRGRLGNFWVSPPGGIYISMVCPLPGSESLTMLPMRVATVLCRELDSILDGPCRVKWPNDLMVDGKKIAGILIETVGKGADLTAIIGLGINYSSDLSESVPTATAVSLETRSAPAIESVAGQVIRALEDILLESPGTAEVAAEYSHWSLHEAGQEIRCRTVGDNYIGEFLGFDELGFLRVRTATGEELIAAGEIIEGEEVRRYES